MSQGFLELCFLSCFLFEEGFFPSSYCFTLPLKKWSLSFRCGIPWHVTLFNISRWSAVVLLGLGGMCLFWFASHLMRKLNLRSAVSQDRWRWKELMRLGSHWSGNFSQEYLPTDLVGFSFWSLKCKWGLFPGSLFSWTWVLPSLGLELPLFYYLT